MDLNIEELQRLIAEYLATLDNVRREERFDSDREYATEELDGFVEWIKKRAVASLAVSDLVPHPLEPGSDVVVMLGEERIGVYVVQADGATLARKADTEGTECPRCHRIIYGIINCETCGIVDAPRIRAADNGEASR